MAANDSITKEISNSDRLNEASILLYRAMAINDLLFNASNNDIESLLKGTLSGSTDALHHLITDAKKLIDGITHASSK